MNNQLYFYKDLAYDQISTEGIKYVGSKLKIIPHILRLADNLEINSVFDAFSGTTRVSQAFAKSDYHVISNDIAVWSEIFATCYLLSQKNPTDYQELIDHLNNVAPIDGWFTEHYGGYPNQGCSVQTDGLKKPWQIHNTRKLDAIRQEIDDLDLDYFDRAVALTSLILALDRVDNTIGHFASYLREWAPRSYNSIHLKIPQLLGRHLSHEVHRSNIFEIISDVSADLTYLDPPYGSNNEKMPPSRVRYASYYHIWTTICLFDRPHLFGKAKRRQDSSDVLSSSVFEEFRKDSYGRYIAVQAIDRLLNLIQSPWIILSYSSNGRVAADELNDVIYSNGKLLKVIEIDYQKNVMSRMVWTKHWTRNIQLPNIEYLFLIEKT